MLQAHMSNLTCHNLSSKILTGAQKQVLGLGLNMVLQPRTVSSAPLRDAVQGFTRSVRLRCQFGISPAPRFRVPNPDFEPRPAPPQIEQLLQSVSSSIQEESMTSVPKRPPSLSLPHYRALSALCRDKSIVIKPADKNLGLTVMDAQAYRRECLRHLSDSSVYVQSQPALDDILADLRYILKNVPFFDISHSVRRFFFHAPKQGYVPALFYVLMKLHKDPPVGRPIAASHSWVTYNVSTWLDAELRTVVRSQPTYLRDSTELVLLFEEQPVPKDAILFTYDVTALYPSIPIATALGFIKQMLEQVRYPKTEILVPLLHWVLSNSYVQFDGVTYKQIQGTAMGTPVAPAFAILFMSALDREMTAHPLHSSILMHRRFIDDGAGVWLGTEESLLSWLEYFNSLIPEIKLTWHISRDNMDFMDVRLFKGKRFDACQILDMETYQKSMNKYLYVPFCSYHPVHCKKGFITSELKRYLIRSSDVHAFLGVSHAFFSRLLARGYPKRFLLPLFQSVLYSARPSLLQRQRTLLQAASGPLPQTRGPPFPLPVDDPPPLVFKAPFEPLTTGLRPRRFLAPAIEQLHQLRPDIFCPRLIFAWKLPEKIGNKIVRARFSMP